MLRVLYSHSRATQFIPCCCFLSFYFTRELATSCFTTIGGKKSINISDCFVCVAYKNLSFNNGFNIFYSITLLTVLFITSAALLL